MIILGGQLHFFVISEENGTQAQFFGFWAAAPKGTKSCRTQGESVRPSVRPYVRPPPPHSQGFVSFGAQIQAKWLKSKQNGPNPSKMAKFWLENLNFGQNSIILAPKI